MYNTVKLFICATALVAAPLALAETEKYDTDEFTDITYSLPYEVEFIAGDEHYVILEGDSEAIENVKVKVNGDTLKLRRDDKSWFDWSHDDSDAIFVTIGYKSIDAIKISGSGDGFAESIESDDFKLAIAGSAHMEIEQLEANDLVISIAGSGDAFIHKIDVDQVESSISGSGNIKLGGQTNGQDITIAGSGDYEATGLRANETDATIRGSGDIEVWSIASLTASVMGSGDIEYYGDPDVNERIRGSGSLERRGEEP